ncbi:MAG: STAS domain-containing protein [Thermomicrobiales bacterium]
MSQTDVTTDARKISDQTSMILVKGSLTAASEHVLMDAYTRASTDRTRAIVLDFDGLDYMNSGGIGLLVTLLVRVNRQRQKLLAFGLSEHYRNIFELTRLNEAIGIYDDETAALAAASAV